MLLFGLVFALFYIQNKGVKVWGKVNPATIKVISKMEYIKKFEIQRKQSKTALEKDLIKNPIK